MSGHYEICVQRIYLCKSYWHHWYAMEEARIGCVPGWELVFELPDDARAISGSRMWFSIAKR